MRELLQKKKKRKDEGQYIVPDAHSFLSYICYSECLAAMPDQIQWAHYNLNPVPLLFPCNLKHKVTNSTSSETQKVQYFQGEFQEQLWPRVRDQEEEEERVDEVRVEAGEEKMGGVKSPDFILLEMKQPVVVSS